MQAVRADRQIRRPDNDAISGFALRDNLKTRNDFPAQRKPGSLLDFGLQGLSRPEHHRLIEKPVRYPQRQGIEDDFQRGFPALWLWRKGPFGTRFARNGERRREIL